MIVLGVNHSHNASVALSVDGEMVFHIEAERINNIRYGYFPFSAIAEITKYVSHIDHLVISGIHPVVNKISELNRMDAYSAFIHGLGRSFFEHEFLVTDMSQEHHLTHAISSYYGSGFNTALCIVKDGAGSVMQTKYGPAAEMETAMVIDKDNLYMINRGLSSSVIRQDIRLDEYTTVTHCESEADAFSSISLKLGFGIWDAGKVMGLSSYGSPSEHSFIGKMGADREKVSGAQWDTFQDKANIAYALQTETEDRVIEYVLEMVRETGVTDVALSGGLFQNCVMNYKILKALPDGSRLYVEPLSTDAGTAVGAVDWHLRRSNAEYSNNRSTLYLGTEPEYKNIDGAVSATARDVAKLISEKNIVAIFQGRSESGTRALGNRSILYDPRDPDGKDRVNTVKKREWFRPFAGSVLHEYAHDWFDMDKLEESAYMLYAINVLPNKADKIPCVVHVNNTCRIQTVKESQNKNFYNLIKEFNDITGIPMVLNTSFNLAGDAIVETIDQALDTLYASDIDALYLPEIGKIVFNKGR